MYLRPGRPDNTCDVYLEGHPARRQKYRVLRNEDHKTLIEVVGKFFPRATDNHRMDYYYASMLLLLKPWRSLDHLKAANQTWLDAFDEFTSNCSDNTKRYLSNIQFYYESRDAASRRNEAPLSDGGSTENIEGEKEYERVDCTNSAGLDMSDVEANEEGDGDGESANETL
jgi:hypothetical protein